jgi:uncharacterized membrane protein
MNKIQFDKELKIATANLPKDEQKRIFDHYDAVYREKRNKNIPEEAIFLGLGSPQLLIEDLTGESIFNRRYKEYKTKFARMVQNHTFWVIYFAGFLITFPLTIALLGFGIALGAAILALVIAFVCVTVTAFLGIPVFIACGVLQIFNGALWPGLTTVGLGITCIAAFILALWILRLLNFARVHFFFTSKSKAVKYDALKMRGRQRRKIMAIICAVSLVVGLGVFGIAYWKMDYDNEIFKGADIIKTIKETVDLIKK